VQRLERGSWNIIRPFLHSRQVAQCPPSAGLYLLECCRRRMADRLRGHATMDVELDGFVRHDDPIGCRDENETVRSAIATRILF
jgi:hypothetical protein